MALLEIENLKVHFETDVDASTLVMTGPARGHWSEETSTNLIIFTVLGNDCRSLPARDIGSSISSQGTFLLGPGVSLCAVPLRDRQRILEPDDLAPGGGQFGLHAGEGVENGEQLLNDFDGQFKQDAKSIIPIIPIDAEPTLIEKMSI